MNRQSDEFAVRLFNVSKLYGYNGNNNVGVKDINLEAKYGELLLIIGPSGSGKTTLLTLIAGLIRPNDGIVNLLNNKIEDYTKKELQKVRAEKIGFVFQNFLLIDSLTVLENVGLVLRFSNHRYNNIHNLSYKILTDLNIKYLSAKFPPTLSQGEKQRVAVARAIANNPALILADEPTASLESSQGFQIIELLHNYAKTENKCVIVVSHDLRLKDFADKILSIENGIIKS